MLQQILADQHVWFFIFHAFLIGTLIGYFVANIATRSFKKKLIHQSKAYEDLINSIEATPPAPHKKSSLMQVIRMESTSARVSEMGM